MANKSNSSIRFLGESTARQSAFRFYLTFNLYSKPKKHQNRNSILPDPPTTMECGIKKRCDGDGKTIFPVTSNNNCLKLCDEGEELSDCKWVSFNFDLQSCILFATDTCTGSDDGFGTISSNVECYIPCPIKEGICGAVSLFFFLLI